MKPTIVAAIQPKWQRFEDEPALRNHLARFLRMARDKGATVAVLPELSGLMLAAPLGREVTMAANRNSFWGRLRSSLGGAPELADLLPTLIDEQSDLLVERYVALFGGLAREFALVIVAGSLLSKTPQGNVEYRSAVFDSDGGLLGWQSKFFLSELQRGLASPGAELHYFDSSVGRLGVLLGDDILIPALVEHLARVDCLGVLNPTMARQIDDWQRQQIVARARANENQLFIAQSYLVGEDDLFAGPQRNLEGRSNVLAPVELTPRRDGILSMVGAEKVEGVVAGEWNVAALRNLIDTTDLPLRRMGRLPLPKMDEALSPALLAPPDDAASPREALPLPAPSRHEATVPDDDQSQWEDDGLTWSDEEDDASAVTEPLVDPATGYYLGERTAPDDGGSTESDDEAATWADVLDDAAEELEEAGEEEA